MYKNVFLRRVFIVLLLVLAIIMFFPHSMMAEVNGMEVNGEVYTFEDKKSTYNFSQTDNSISSAKSETYGKFSISGMFSNTYYKDGFPAYEVKGDSVSFIYSYGDKILNNPKEEWHLVNDPGKKVDEIKLDSKINKGVIILQSSKDGNTWINVSVKTNILSDKPVETDPLYETKDIELTNGTYYRLIVAYECAYVSETSQVLFIKRDKEVFKKVAEVYKFYLQSASTFNNKNTERYYLGTKVNTGSKDNGYSGNVVSTENDPHNGWEIGKFFVEGFTQHVDDNGTPIIIKNVGDQVQLSFNLSQDINKLNNHEGLSIQSDDDGWDQEFEVQRLKSGFGKGTLIIRHTDYENKKSDPIVYTNFLEANAVPNADTIVKLFEEGDYEVALDYEVRCNKSILGIEFDLFPDISHYRIRFNFKVRNGNCMVFPFEVETGNELTNESITDKGFYIDLANSRYLKTNIIREILKEGETGLEQDTRYNRPAKDKEQFTEEGIYTITVNNLYTGQETIKKIYVGSDKLLMASIANNMDVSVIQQMVIEGAQIGDNGTLIINVNQTNNSGNENITENSNAVESVETQPVEEVKEKKTNIWIPIGITAMIIIATLTIILKKKSNVVIANNRVNVKIEKNTNITSEANAQIYFDVNNEEKEHEKND